MPVHHKSYWANPTTSNTRGYTAIICASTVTRRVFDCGVSRSHTHTCVLSFVDCGSRVWSCHTGEAIVMKAPCVDRALVCVILIVVTRLASHPWRGPTRLCAWRHRSRNVSSLHAADTGPTSARTPGSIRGSILQRLSTNHIHPVSGNAFDRTTVHMHLSTNRRHTRLKFRARVPARASHRPT